MGTSTKKTMDGFDTVKVKKEYPELVRFEEAKDGFKPIYTSRLDNGQTFHHLKKLEKTTKKPTGVTIARSGTKWTFSWKKADEDYKDGQTAEWCFDRIGITDGWQFNTYGNSTTSFSQPWDKQMYYPYTDYKVKYIRFKIRAKRHYTEVYDKKSNTITITNYDQSDWVSKTFEVYIPKTPSLSVSKSSSYANQSTFSWSIATSTTDHYIFSNYQWQSVLVKDCKETDGSKITFGSSKLGWLTGTGTSTSTSRTITEDTTTLANGSYTRWFRIRSRGPRGASDWKYAKHVYAMPNQATINSVSATKSGGNMKVNVKWTAASNAARPIDSTTVSYAIAVPAAGLTCPSGASWTEASVSKDTSGTDSAVFEIPDSVGVDECLFVRVDTQHDENINYGKPTLAYTGYVADPSGLSVDADYSTYRATITATNNSEIPDSVLVVEYRPSSGDSFPIGIIPHGQTSVTVQAPNWSKESSVGFAVYAMVGSYTKKSRPDGADSYSVTAKKKSQNTITGGGEMPMPPTGLTVEHGLQNTTVSVSWNWSWKKANGAEISWSDHADAWESTDEPETYILSNLHASKWNIANLETGKTWYVRVRFFMVVDDNITYGPYTNVEAGEIDLASAPVKPVLELSNSIITTKGTTTASWVYVTTDNTSQSYAEVAIVDGTKYTPIVHVGEVQHVTLNNSSLKWGVGSIHSLAVRVQSGSGKFSEWSDPVAVTVADPLVCTISNTSLVEETVIVDGDDEPIETKVLKLTEMPFDITISGAGEGGTTSLVIERAEAYHMDRPDEDEFNGYEGETIYTSTQVGEQPFSIAKDALIGSLDDGALYRIVATVQDGLGQTDTDELIFTVQWNHQAVKPNGLFDLDYENYIAKITPILPEDGIETDTVDIYRLSADKPQLIVENGIFGETYVDPYPALGEFGGHRLVLKTANGDYITEDNEIAWLDSTEFGLEPLDMEEVDSIIDFGTGQVKLYYDTDTSSNWQKDFQETQYLGGSIQGDWNPAVSRSDNILTKAITTTDQDIMIAIRRLADYAGICHVRKMDGSSFAANVDVSIDRSYADRNMLENYSLNITQVDTEELDGMTLAEWEAIHPPENVEEEEDTDELE